MTTLAGTSEAITVFPGPTGRCGPGSSPEGCTDCGITDDFARTSSSGWHTASSGLVWQDGNGFSTDGRRGLVVVDAGVSSTNNFNVLSGPASGGEMMPYSEVVITGQIISDGSPANANRKAYIGGDDINDGCTVSLATDGTFSLETYNDSTSVATSVDAHVLWMMRFKIDSGTVYARVWAAASPEPTSWTAQLAITVSQFSYDFFAGGSIPFPQTTPITVAFQTLTVSGVDRCTQYVFDDFNRTQTPNWGTVSSGGPVWIRAGSHSYTATDGVGAGVGYIHTSVGPGPAPWLGSVSESASGVTGVNGTFTAYASFRPGRDNATGGYQFNFGVVYLNVNRSPAQLLLGIFDGSQTTFSGDFFFDLSGSDICVRVLWDGTQVHARFWAIEDTEPATYPYTLSRNGTQLFHAGEVGVILGGEILESDGVTVATSAGNAALFPSLTVSAINFDYATKSCFPGSSQQQGGNGSTGSSGSGGGSGGSGGGSGGGGGGIIVPVPPSSTCSGGVGATSGAYTTRGPIDITTDGYVLDGYTITADTFESGALVNILGTWDHPVDRVIIQNCLLVGRQFGILARHATNLTVRNCFVSDQNYAGIAGYSVVGGTVVNNTVRRIGVTRTDFSDPGQLNNAYGITFDRAHSGNLTTDPQSADLEIGCNDVQDVPLWMCINLHAGLHVIIHDNLCAGAPRAMFFAGDGDTNLNPPAESGYLTIKNNTLLRCVTKAGGSQDKESILISHLSGTASDNVISGNSIGTSFPGMVFDYQGLSHYTDTGNVRVAE